jgi:uncharacterized membrane protein
MKDREPVHMNDDDGIASLHPRATHQRGQVVVALTSLAALIVLSIAFALMPVAGMSPGYVLAFLKVVTLGFIFMRLKDGNVYTMQWSSMFILLFMAEGVVRAMTDPQPSSAMGALEVALTVVYFVAVLTYLRPLKKLAKAAQRT